MIFFNDDFCPVFARNRSNPVVNANRLFLSLTLPFIPAIILDMKAPKLTLRRRFWQWIQDFSRWFKPGPRNQALDACYSGGNYIVRRGHRHVFT